MSFLSFNFAIFAGLALSIFYAAPPRWRPGVLLGLSYFFYLTWSPIYTLLLAAVTTGVYATALWVEGRCTERGKRAGMAVGVMTLLALLFAFKSAAWFLSEFHANPATVIVIPLGLSYYVFKMVGYLLDVYWETLPAQHNFVSVALYGSFFPQIVGGPIQRAGSFFDQIDQIKNPDANGFQVGLRRILFGLFKKIAVADGLAGLVGNVHANPSAFSTLELLVGAYCFAIQLYADFSGITDIAIGLGLLFGMKGPENFYLPFFSPNIQQFWRRWHMSLTTWLGDYLFTPLRMSFRKLGTTGLCLAIFINMVAIGLWHGFSLTFLVFGILNGVFMTVSVLTLKQRDLFFKDRPQFSRLRGFVAPLLTFHLVVFALIFFRAETLASAGNYVEGLVPGMRTGAISALRFDTSLLGVTVPALTFYLAAFLASEAVTWAARRRFWIDWFFTMPGFFRRTAYCAMVAVVLFEFRGTISFIYARF